MEPKTLKEIEEIVNTVKFRDWDICLRYFDMRPYIQIQFDAPDSITGEIARQYCRKWALSLFMTKSEIIRTIYKAIEAAVQHEMQEDFKYKGQPIFRPHFNVDALYDLSKQDVNIDRRD